MRIAIAGALVCALMSCYGRPAPVARPAPLSAVQARADAAVLVQLERDLAVLRAARRDTLGGPAAFRAAAASVSNQMRRSDAAMVAAASVTPPPVHVSYPSQYRATLVQRNARALALARQQFSEKEAAGALAFEKNHEGQRLQVQLRLQALHLDAKTRRVLRAQLAVLDAQQNAAAAAQRATDDAALARYGAELNAQSNAASTAMGAEVRDHPADTRGAAVPPVDVARAVAVADDAGRDINARFAELQSRDADASRALDAEIAALSAECQRLRVLLRQAQDDTGK